MNSSYKHLTLSERESIMLMHSQGKTQTEIAQALGRSAGTISRELKRHSLAEYRASLAHSSYQAHRKRCKAPLKLQQAPYRRLIQEKILQEGWSPEQLSARLKLEKSDLSISYTTIYRGIYQGLFDVGERKASRKLRHKGKSRHNKGYLEKRGKEFAKHHLATQALGVAFYFPEPHQPWQRGTNENTNGLLQEYFPKQQDINQWNDDDIQRVIDKLNLRPRKCLGWKTPCEVYFGKSLHLV